MDARNIMKKFSFLALFLLVMITAGCKEDSSSGSSVTGSSGTTIDGSTSGGGITTNPEPISAALFAMGMAAFGLRKAVKRK